MSLQEEIDLIEKAGYSESARILRAYAKNPQARMYVSITQFVEAICNEIDAMTKVGESILDAEDKKFERISTMIKNYTEFSDVFKSGKDMVHSEENQDGETNEEDFFKRNAKRRNNKQREA